MSRSWPEADVTFYRRAEARALAPHQRQMARATTEEGEGASSFGPFKPRSQQDTCPAWSCDTPIVWFILPEKQSFGF